MLQTATAVRTDGVGCGGGVLGGGGNARLDSCKFLLKKGANICTTVNGSTVLMEAVQRNRLDFVDYLVVNADKLGLDVNVKDGRGSNVLYYAASVGNPQIFQRLVEAGCRVETDSYERNVFMQAALHGHVDMLKYLAFHSERLTLNTHQLDSDGRNCLFYGVESGRLEAVQFLVSIGIKCLTDRTGKTNLMQSARAGNDVITSYLLTHANSLCLDVGAVDSKGENALFYAVRSRQASVVAVLLDNSDMTLCSNVHGQNIVTVSLAHGLDDIIDVILDRASNRAAAGGGGGGAGGGRGEGLQSAAAGPPRGGQGEGLQPAEGALAERDAKGRTVLHHFVDRDDVDRLRRYSRQLYREESDCDLSGSTLLMCACKSSEEKRLDVVRYLVEELQVDVYRVDSKQRCALFYAVESGNITVTSYLIQHMTSSPKSDVNGLSLIMVAVVTGNQAVVKELLKSKFARDLLNKVDKNGRNEIHYCAMHDCTAILTDLLAGPNKLNVDLRDIDGKTPLMYAAENGRHATVSCLLRRGGARVDPVDSQGRNALHYCVSGSATSPSLYCARVLVQRGADVNGKDSSGVTPLMLACQTCAKTNITVIRLLLDQGADPIAQDKDGSDAFDYCPFDSEYVKGVLREKTEIQPAQRDALTAFQTTLSESGGGGGGGAGFGGLGGTLHINSVLRGLLKEGVFTKTLNFEVMKQPHTERLRKLVELLSTRGEKAFNAFCTVLKREGAIEMAYLLQKEAYRKELEIYW